MGPTRRWSFNKIPDFILVDASKTACICNVVLDAFITACMGMLSLCSHGFPQSDVGRGSAWSILKYSITESANSQNVSFAFQLRPTVRNHFPVIDLDSPNGSTCGFLGRGAINLPVSSLL